MAELVLSNNCFDFSEIIFQQLSEIAILHYINHSICTYLCELSRN